MNAKPVIAIAALIAVAGTLAFTQPAKDSKPGAAKPGAAQPSHQPAGKPADMQLPPGVTAEDMQACMEAGTPGEMHAWLAEAVGTWNGKTKVWMAPDTEPVASECVTTISSFLDGRFIKCETAGDMPGMGPFSGFGLTGFDNVTQKFQGTWIDSCSTAMLTGAGERSSDGTTLTINLNYTCPITKKPAVFRQVEHRTGKDAMTLEMFMKEPHSGKEYKMLEIAYTRAAGAVNGSAPKASH